jgi:hypothetical protein
LKTDDFQKKLHPFIAEKSGGIDLNLTADELLDKSKRVNLRRIGCRIIQIDNWIFEFAKELTEDEKINPQSRIR